MTHNEAVWKGAWGMSPFGKGTPRRPAIPVTRPNRKKSQSTIRSVRVWHTKRGWFLERKLGALTNQGLISAAPEEPITEIL